MQRMGNAALVLFLVATAADAAAQCYHDTDCRGRRVCERGLCVEGAQCSQDADCGRHRVCERGRCVEGLPYELAPRNVISTNPLSILAGSVGLQYERVLARWFSLALGVSFYDSKMDPINSSDIPMLGAMVTLQPRFYVQRRGAPRGFFLSPVVSLVYMSAAATEDTRAVTGMGYAVGGQVGWSWLVGQHFNIKLGLGVQYLHFTATDDTGRVVGVEGIAPLGDLAFGGAF